MTTRTLRSLEHSIHPPRRLATSKLTLLGMACPMLALWMLATQGIAAPGFAAPRMARQAADAPAIQDTGNKQDQPDEAPEENVLEIVWRTDITAAKVEANRAGKPILYYFRCDP